MSSRTRRLCYPWGNYSASPGPRHEGHGGSLGPAFAPGFHIGRNPVRPAFALALFATVLTRLSRPLGTRVMFSRVCRPSATAQQHLSPPCGGLAAVIPVAGVSGAPPPPPERWVRRLPATLCTETTTAGTACSKAPRVFSSHRGSPDCSPDSGFAPILLGTVGTSLIRSCTSECTRWSFPTSPPRFGQAEACTYQTRHLATLRGL